MTSGFDFNDVLRVLINLWKNKNAVCVMGQVSEKPYAIQTVC